MVFVTTELGSCMKQKFKVGIIGAGTISEHIEAIADVEINGAQTQARKYGVKQTFLRVVKRC